MKKYKLLQPVMLSYLKGNDQVDAGFYPEDADYTLESDGETIWVILGETRLETITIAHAIDIWLDQGKIKEI